MWTIMKAPLLLGNDIRIMDPIALAVVTNKDALNISQDSLGVQAKRVSSTSNKHSTSASTSIKSGAAAAARVTPVAVAARCDQSRPTQVWTDKDGSGLLATTDAHGQEWCLHDVHGTEEVGSWRGVPCSSFASSDGGAGEGGTKFNFQEEQQLSATTLIINTRRSGAHLTLENKMGASGPTAHTRYIATDSGYEKDGSAKLSRSSNWIRKPAAAAAASTHHTSTSSPSQFFSLMATDTVGVLADDKVGGVTAGGNFCLDLVYDTDSEVWAGPLASNKWAVALLNRDPTANATITVDFASMLNVTAGTSFDVRDVWQQKDAGTSKGSYTSTVMPQAVTYLILTPASSMV